MPASLGLKAMAASFPVVIASDQSSFAISGTVELDGLDPQAHGGADSGAPLKVGGKYVASPTAVDDGDRTNALSDQFGQQRVVIGDASDASETVNVQGGAMPVILQSHAISVPFPVFLTDSGGDALNPLPVSGPLTDTQLRATAVPVSGTVTVTGVATAANQATEIGHLDGVEGLLTTIDADTGSIMTAVQLIDDTVAVLGTDTYTEATTKGTTIGAVRRDADTTLVGTTNEIGPLQMDANGRLKVEAFSGETLPVSLASTTVTGTVAVSIATAPALVASSANIGDVDVLTIAAGDNNIGNVDVVTLPNVTIGTMAALVAGSAAIGKLAANSGVDIGDTDVTSVIPGTGATNLGKAVDSAGASTDTGVAALGLREDALVTITPADGDYTRMKMDSLGKQWVNTGLSPELYISKSFNATTTQTGIDVWDPAGGKKIAVSSVVIGTYGTTAARVILWFGDNADTTYSAGTDQLLLAASFVPSATASPGLVFTPAQPVICNTADRELHVTTSAGISLDIAVHGWEF